MDASTGIAAGSLVMAGISAYIASRAVRIASRAVRESKRLQKEQWKRDELEIRRDVLRRLVAHCYLLTPSFQGKDGEPFIALNEAWVVFADFPKVIKALDKMHNELEKKDSLIEKKDSLSCNILNVVRAMAEVAEISIKDLDDKFIERPFTPPRPIP